MRIDLAEALFQSALIGSSGGGGGVSVQALSVSSNGTYTAPSGYAYSPVSVNVPQPSGTSNITSNGTYDVTNYASAFVNVSGGGNAQMDGIIDGTVSGIIVTDATECKSNIFYQCSNLEGIQMSLCQHIRQSAFMICTSLTTVYAPNSLDIEASAFLGCTKLSDTNFDKVKQIGSQAFRGCTSLTSLSFPAASFIMNSAFMSCPSMTDLYLMGSSVVSIMASTFAGSPFSSGASPYAVIHVPASLYSTYVARTYWSVISSHILSA